MKLSNLLNNCCCCHPPYFPRLFGGKITNNGTAVPQGSKDFRRFKVTHLRQGGKKLQVCRCKKKWGTGPSRFQFLPAVRFFRGVYIYMKTIIWYIHTSINTFCGGIDFLYATPCLRYCNDVRVVWSIPHHNPHLPPPQIMLIRHKAPNPEIKSGKPSCLKNSCLQN